VRRNEILTLAPSGAGLILQYLWIPDLELANVWKAALAAVDFH